MHCVLIVKRLPVLYCVTEVKKSLYKAYFSNSLEKFIDNYSSLFSPAGLFDRNSVFIVQNSNMEEWLKLRLADKTGVFAGINFQFQDETLRNIISLSPEVSRALETKKTIYLDDLKLIIFHTLNNIFRSIEDYPEFSTLKSYVNHEYPLSEGDMNNIKSTRLYRLSDSIAGLFHHYGLNSSEMIRKWEARMSYAAGTEFSYLEGNERWQMRLWDIIFGKDSSYLHPGQIIAGILDGKYNIPPVNKKIIIFGSSFLSEQAVEFFHYLSSSCSAEIHHFILSPSPFIQKPEVEKSLILSQWGNIVTGLAEMLVGKGVDIHEDYLVPEGGVMPEGCEVIAESRGPEGSKSAGTVSEVSEIRGPDECKLTGITMLSALKNAVFSNLKKCSGFFDQDDSSLRVISVPGKKREIEILKNNIIYLMDKKGYDFYDIGVAAPDINSYVPFIDSVFRSGDPALDIPYNLMDVSFVENSDYLNGFFSLLDLTGSRFSRKQLFSLFNNRCFKNRFHLSDSDVDKWLEICDRLFIKWGYDSEHREEIISRKSDFATWKKALDRVGSGFLFSEEEGSLSLSSGSDITPYQLSGSSEENTAASLFQAVNLLYRNIYGLRFSEYEIPAWAMQMEKIADFFLSPVYGTGDDDDRKFLKNVFRQINTLVIENSEAESISEKPVPYSLYRMLIDEFAGKSGYCRGQYLAEGISFSSLKPLRAIPFKVIFLLGMDENSFPGREKSRNYDLRSLTPKSIDLSVQNTDCFTFLETVLSAGEKLFISYTGTNIITGEILEPSPLVTEILSMFESSEAEKIHVAHPLHSHNSVYFEETGRFRDFISFDRLDFRAASVMKSRQKKTPPLLELDTGFDLPDEVEAETDIYRFERFLKYPVSFFLEYVEGIKASGTQLLENDETEHFGLTYSDNNVISREIADSSDGEDRIFERYVEEGRTAGILNNCSVSDYECLLSGDDYEKFRSNLVSEGYFESDPVEVVLSEHGARGKSSLISFPPVEVLSEKGRLSISGYMKGLRRRGSSWFVISYDSIKYRNMISPFFRYLLLRKITGDSDIELNVFSREGKTAAVISDSDIDPDAVLNAAACSYIESFNSPVTVDISCMAELIRDSKNIKNIDDFFGRIDDYYSVNSFSDSIYLNHGSDISLNYRNEDFYRLYQLFYSCLDFSRRGK